MKNRRKFSRRKTSIPCCVEWEDHTFDGEITNISPGGVLISKINNLPPIDSVIQISFEVKEKVTPIRLAARVIHTKLSSAGGAFGVQFEEPPEDVQLKLAVFLAG